MNHAKQIYKYAFCTGRAKRVNKYSLNKYRLKNHSKTRLLSKAKAKQRWHMRESQQTPLSARAQSMQQRTRRTF